MADEMTMEVLDKLVTPAHPTRVHEVMLENGLKQSYTFHYGKRTEMPFGHAMQFLRHPEGFEVYEAGKDEPYDPAPEQPEGLDFVLQPGTTVASLAELTNGALAKRAAQFPDGAGFRKTSSKAKLIEFLRAKQDEGKAVEPDMAADEFTPDAFDDAELA